LGRRDGQERARSEDKGEEEEGLSADAWAYKGAERWARVCWASGSNETDENEEKLVQWAVGAHMGRWAICFILFCFLFPPQLIQNPSFQLF